MQVTVSSEKKLVVALRIDKFFLYKFFIRMYSSYKGVTSFINIFKPINIFIAYICVVLLILL
jgi:hypothetical protein